MPPCSTSMSQLDKRGSNYNESQLILT